MTQWAVLRWLAWPGALALLVPLAVLRPCEAASPTLLSGKRLEQQLEQPLTVAWSNLSFREALASLSATQRLAVQIDRRIDADAPFELTIPGDPLRTALLKIAERKGVGVSRLGPVVYFGPKQAAHLLQTIAAQRRDEVQALPVRDRLVLLKSRATEWPDLAQPRKLLNELAEEAGVKILGDQQIPHDLWAANHWPAIPWTDRMTLLLIQFGLTWELAEEGRSVRLVPLPETATITRTYAGGSQAAARAKQLQAKVPAAKIRVEGDRLVAEGRMEDHDEITQLLSGRPVRTTTVRRGTDVYKLKVDGLPLNKVLSQLGNMLKLTMKYDEAAINASGIAMDQLISFEVENATLDDLLTAALKDTGLTYDRQNQQVTIHP